LTINRGDLHYADLGRIGRKIVLVVSWDEVNVRLRQPVVCLVTSKDRERSLDTYVAFDPPEGGVKEPSFVLGHALLTVEDWRLETRPLGTLSTETMAKVKRALARTLML
jgi:mRNA-degrading endonuclease toxin of MazEF toxin-antitoxin module